MIPVISLNDKNIVEKMRKAYSTIGFAVFTEVYDNWILEFTEWFQMVENFFALPSEIKLKYSYSGVAENIGFGCLGQESLTPNMPGDLKETFNWSNPPHMPVKYWPVEITDFRSMAEKIHRISRLISYKFLADFEKALRLSSGTLVEKHLDNVDIMRINHYPANLKATEKKYTSIILIKNEEIERLSKLAGERRDYSQWWAAGGIIVGIGLTLAVVYSVKEIAN